LVVTERDAARRHSFSIVYALLVLESLLFLYYVARGVDFVVPIQSFAYVGYFYRVVPLLVLLTPLVHLCVRLALRTGRRPWLTLAVSGVAAVCAVTTVVSSDIGHIVPAGLNYAEGARILEDLAAAEGGPIVITNDMEAVWPTGAGLGLALERDGADWCITGAYALPIMFGDQVCTTREIRRGLVVGITDLGVPAGGRLVWDDDLGPGGPPSPRMRAGPVIAYVALTSAPSAPGITE